MSTKSKHQEKLPPRENLNKFRKRIEKNRLPIREEIELIKSGDALRFEFYVEKHKLSFKAERYLINSRRKELFDIYFMALSDRNEKCHEDNEVLLVQIPTVFKSYHQAELIPGKKAQKHIVDERKRTAIRRFISKSAFCEEVEKTFFITTDDELLTMYGQLYSGKPSNLLYLVEIKMIGTLQRFVAARGIPEEVISLLNGVVYA